MEQPVQPDARYPVSAVMESTRSKRGPWHVPVWRLIGFVAGQYVSGDSPQRLPVHTGEGQTQWLWTGLNVALFRDSAESYWYDLVGRRPSLFLVCREHAEGDLARGKALPEVAPALTATPPLLEERPEVDPEV